MRAFPRLLGIAMVGLLLFSGCKNGGGLGGNSSDDQNQQKQQPQQKKQAGAPSQPPNTEPAASVTGQPSAASDSGTSDAVAHHSVAEPGAPEGTVPDPSHKPAPKSSPPQH